jgi:polyisoprenoid-binding protein YceI
MLFSIIRHVLRAFTILIVTTAYCLAAALTLEPNSTLWLVGDSTLHPFTSRTSQIQTAAQVDLGASTAQDVLNAVLQRQGLKTFDVSIPVKSLKSNESGLDKNMYKALKADACPSIDFHMTQYKVKTSSAEEQPVRASGTLRVACQEKAVTLDTNVIPETGVLHVNGQYTLMMTDYGVKPPSMMMGAIKVKNPVVIHFDLLYGISQ